MNTKHLKNYAPKARRQFIQAVENRLAWLGIYPNTVAEVSFQGDSALIEGRVFSRKQAEQRNRLIDRIASRGATGGFAMFVREMAYTWFNRLAAIRFMELKGYLEHGYRVLSSKDGSAGLPEILDYAADVADLLQLNKKQMIELQLAGNQQEKLYRELLLGQCHYLHAIMPFMFEALDDATELLLPDNLTKTDSILKGLVEEIPEHDWQNIEVIGWLYQFYISEHKDAVIGKVVKSEDIPAATQLFTPNWIVKYLVQNSVGRQWLQTYPDSAIKAQMEYYIGPGEQPAEVIAQLQAHTPASIEPESIKVLDPACGSGHILVEVYELLREIYLERGYRLRDIPQLILTKNIFGLDIDDRAAQLSGFALMMKAREDDRRIFERVKNEQLQLNIFALQQTDTLDINRLWQALNLEGKQQRGSSGDLFGGLDDALPQVAEPTQHGLYHQYFTLLQYLKTAFAQAKTLGSLVQIEHSKLEALQNLQALLLEKQQGTDPAAKQAAEVLMPIVLQALVLAQQYDAVIANPPYMGSSLMCSELKEYVETNFSDSKTDIYACFITAGFKLLKEGGFNALVTMETWMFLSAYSSFRQELLSKFYISNLAHLEKMVMGIAFRTAATIFHKLNLNKVKGRFIFVDKGDVVNGAVKFFPPVNSRLSFIESNNFLSIKGCPIAYWLPGSLLGAFSKANLKTKCVPRIGIQSGDNEKFYRFWFEVSKKDIKLDVSTIDEVSDIKCWIPLQRGGDAKKWFGNNDYIVDFSFGASEIKQTKNSSLRNSSCYFKTSITWNRLSQTRFFVRHIGPGYAFDDLSPFSQAVNENEHYKFLALLGSSSARYLISFLSTGRKTEVGHVSAIPLPTLHVSLDTVNALCIEVIDLARKDYNSVETSRDFAVLDVIALDFFNEKLAVNYEIVNDGYQLRASRVRQIEQEINNIYSKAYQLEGFVDDSVNLSDVTLLRNPAYSFAGLNDVIELQSLTKCEQQKELLSYTIGCMMGRYSIDKPGLILASQGETLQDYLNQIPNPRFMPDSDAILPLTDQEWFADDVTNRVREFVKVVWGEETLQENLVFIAESLCLHAIKPKKSEGALDTIRRYLSTQFYKDHLKTYKKRPIYWLFSSGKEKAFECLVYLHRYNESTLARMRTEYVTPLMGKYDAQHSLLLEQKTDASPAQQREFEKELKALEKKQTELRAFDEQLKHYADMRIKLDLDDGVKVNYGKFGNLLAEVKAITGDKE